jgi:hypothetical protein
VNNFASYFAECKPWYHALTDEQKLKLSDSPDLTLPDAHKREFLRANKLLGITEKITRVLRNTAHNNSKNV